MTRREMRCVCVSLFFFRLVFSFFTPLLFFSFLFGGNGEEGGTNGSENRVHKLV